MLALDPIIYSKNGNNNHKNNSNSNNKSNKSNTNHSNGIIEIHLRLSIIYFLSKKRVNFLKNFILTNKQQLK